MVNNLTPESRLQADTLLNDNAWVWLFEFYTPENPPRAFRLTTFSRKIDYGTHVGGDLDGLAITYYPAPIKPGVIQQSADGDLPTISITIGNVPDSTGKRIGQHIDEMDGLRDRPVTIRVLNAADLEAVPPVLEERGLVQGATVTSEVITLKVGAMNLYRAQFPPALFAKRRCRWTFGSAECGYDVSLGAHSECNFSLSDCTERGDDEVERDLTRQHPLRFGNTPGIPRGGRR